MVPPEDGVGVGGALGEAPPPNKALISSWDMVPPEDGAAGSGAEGGALGEEPPPSKALISSWDMVPPEEEAAAGSGATGWGSFEGAGAGASFEGAAPPLKETSKGAKRRFAKSVDIMFINSLLDRKSVV